MLNQTQNTGRHDLRDYQAEAIQIINSSLKHCLNEPILRTIVIPTGGGKTVVFCRCVRSYVNAGTKKVIILVPNWELGIQAVTALTKELGSEDKIRRIGKAKNNNPLNYLATDLDGDVFITTIHTWHHSDTSCFNQYKGDLLIIIDEVHWGINQTMMKKVFKFCYGDKHSQHCLVPVLGFTATPRNPSHIKQEIIFNITFSNLVERGYLARPIVHNIETGFIWDPIFTRTGTISEGTLKKLNTPKRNKVVINSAEKAFAQPNRRGIMFAANIAHANTLFELFSQRHIPCSIIHGGLKPEEKTKAINDFRQGRTRLVINVNMLTKGIDVPEITDVFLVRPCDSEVLLAQMIGRGSRIIPNVKEEFVIHDFLDRVDSENAKRIFHGDDYFADKDTVSGSRGKRPWQHRYPDAPHVVLLDSDLHLFEGIEFVENQTFGIEIEITNPRFVPEFGTSLWDRGAERLISTLTDALGENLVYQSGLSYHGSRYANALNHWRVEADSSAGWEVISPILLGREDLQQLITVCSTLQSLLSEESDLFHINYLCGFHLTLATRLNDANRRRRVMAAITRLEPGLFTLVSPSRLFSYDHESHDYSILHRNEYCCPLSDLENESELRQMVRAPINLDESSYRYLSVNFTKIDTSPNLLEIRMHNSTVESIKIVPWIALWMAIINCLTYEGSKKLNTTTIFSNDNLPEQEDIFRLLKNENIHLSDSLLKFLKNRRKELAPRWELAIPGKVWQWEQLGWYS